MSDGLPYQNYAERLPQHDNPLTNEEIASLVRALLQYDKLLGQAVRAELEEHHFNGPGENVFFVLYSAMRQLHEQHGAVTQEMLVVNIRAWAEHGYVHLAPIEEEFLFGTESSPGFIADACRPTTLDEGQQRAERTFYEAILRRFLNARSIKAGLQNVINSVSADAAPADPAALLEQFQVKAQKIKHIGTVIENAAVMPMPGTEIELPPPPIPTGIPWIDNFIGGIRPKDILGLLGPFAGGKTTMLISASVRIAEMFWASNQNKLSVFLGYEDGAEKSRHLCWAAAAHINRTLFAHGFNWSDFSTRENPKPYDLELPENRNGQVVLGELERWNAAMRWYNSHFFYMDFAHSKGTQTGKGGIEEVAVALREICEQRQCEIGFIAIDYAGLMIDRHVSATRNASTTEYSRHLSRLPDDIRRIIADDFGCTVMLAHQLAPGDYKKSPPGKYLHHTDAQGSKSFAENLHSCACINQKDNDSRASTIQWSKIRALLPPAITGIVKIPQDLVDMQLVSDDYYVDPMTNKILRRGEVRTFGGDEESRSRPLPQVDMFSDAL